MLQNYHFILNRPRKRTQNLEQPKNRTRGVHYAVVEGYGSPSGGFATGQRRSLPLDKGVEGVWGEGGIEVLTPQLNRHIALLGCEVAHNGHTLVVGPHEDNGRCASASPHSTLPCSDAGAFSSPPE